MVSDVLEPYCFCGQALLQIGGADMNSAQNLYDVRAVRFIKAQNIQKFAKERSLEPFSSKAALYAPTSKWLYCFGHFDFVEIKKLPDNSKTPDARTTSAEDTNLQRTSETYCRNPLSAIKDDRSVMEVGPTFPLYLLKRCNNIKDTQELDSFWNEEYHYTAFVRLHCKKEFHMKILSETLTELCLEQCFDNETTDSDWPLVAASPKRYKLRSTIHYPIARGERDATVQMISAVSWAIYDSLDLGDAVAVLRSDCMAAIMHATLELRQLELVHGTYTYYGIDPLVLSSDLSALSDEKIYASTRFALQTNDPEAMQHLSSMCPNDSMAFVTGSTDYLINWGNVSERELVEFLKKLLEDTKLPSKIKESITRVGLPINAENTPPIKRSDVIDKSLQKLINSIKDLRDVVETDLFSFNYLEQSSIVYAQNWFLSLKRLTDTFFAMSKDPVTDDVSLLILPGIKALLYQIVLHLNQSMLSPYGAEGSGLIAPNWNPAEDDRINYFISDCVALSNDIASIEGPLFQRPDLTPTQHFIPVTMLRFTQEFVRLCCKAFRDGRQYMPVVVASHQHDISTECPISKELLYKDENGLCPLKIDLPMDMLYQPWMAAIQLCHEAAHYCGIKTRRRRERLTCLSDCIAHYILCSWSIWANLKGDDIASNEYQAHRKTLQALYCKSLEDGFGSNIHLSEVIEALIERAIRLYSDREEFERFNDCLLVFQPEEKRIAQINYYNQISNQISLTVGQYNIVHHLYYLEYLCKECYADLAMLVLLGCSVTDYYRGVFQREFSRLKIGEAFRSHRDSIPQEINKYFDRIAFVIDAMSSIRNTWKPDKIRDDLLKQDIDSDMHWLFNSALEKLGDEWNVGTLKHTEYILYLDEVNQLKQYFRGCVEELKSSMENSRQDAYIGDYVFSLRRALKTASEKSFDLEEIQRFLLHDSMLFHDLNASDISPAIKN